MRLTIVKQPFSSTSPPHILCVDKIGSRPRGNLCVDKIGSVQQDRATRSRNHFFSRPILAGRPIVSLCPHNCTLARLIIKYPAYQLLGKKKDLKDHVRKKKEKKRTHVLCTAQISKFLISAKNRQFFSQKLRSWVFNDQPCECAYVALMAEVGGQG